LYKYGQYPLGFCGQEAQRWLYILKNLAIGESVLILKVVNEESAKLKKISHIIERCDLLENSVIN
jgi:hypothetical protein